MTFSETRASSLSADAVKESPRPFNFAEGYYTTWIFYDVVTCSYCGKPTRENGWCEVLECENYELYQQTEGPVMNYFYPLPVDIADAYQEALKIVHLPLCLVYLLVSDEWGLALTGGGMDFSWEICEAYIRLGFLPPSHFARLPDMTEYYDKRAQVLFRCCNRSLEIHRDSLDRDIVAMRSLRKKMRKGGET